MQARGAGSETCAVGGGAEPVVGLEPAGEVVLVWPADLPADAGDGLVGVQQQGDAEMAALDPGEDGAVDSDARVEF